MLGNHSTETARRGALGVAAWCRHMHFQFLTCCLICTAHMYAQAPAGGSGPQSERAPLYVEEDEVLAGATTRTLRATVMWAPT